MKLDIINDIANTSSEFMRKVIKQGESLDYDTLYTRMRAHCGNYTEHNDDICKVINYDTDKMIERLYQLANDIDDVITVDKKNVPDNESHATIMKLAHIPDSKQDR